MRITIAAVGKLKPSPEYELLHKYIRQTPWQIDIREVEAKKALSGLARMAAEAELLRAAVASAPVKVMLDERGKSLPSEQFSRTIGQWQGSGHSHLAFVLGGHDGLHEMLRSEASLLMSLGAQTWPHMLARVLLCEQLYRAHTILSGHPYHRS